MPSTNVDIILRARDEATAKMRGLANEMGGLVGTVQRLSMGLGGFGGVLAGISTGAGAAVAATKALADTAEQLVLATSQTGIAIGPLQAMFKIVEDGGGDTEALVKAIVKLNREIAVANPLLTKLGITTKDPLQAFLQLASRLSESGDTATVTAIAFELLGKSGGEVVPHMDELAKSVAAVQTAMEESGEAITTKMLPTLSEFDTSIESLGSSWKGLWNDMVTASAGPATIVVKILDGLLRASRGFGRSIHDTTLGLLRDLAAAKSGGQHREAPLWQNAVPTIEGIEVFAARIKALPGMAPPPKSKKSRDPRAFGPEMQDMRGEEWRRLVEAAAKEQAEFWTRHMLIPGFGAPGGIMRLPGGPGGIVGQQEKTNPFKDVLEDWEETAAAITDSVNALSDGIGAVWDGLRNGMQQVFAGMLVSGQTFKSAMDTLFRSLVQSIMSYLADLVASAVFQLFLKLAKAFFTSGASSVMSSGPIGPVEGFSTTPVGPALGTFASTSVGASMAGARGGDTYYIQTFSAKDLLTSLVSPHGELRSANSRLIEIAAAS